MSGEGGPEARGTRVLIGGGSGFIGHALTTALRGRGDGVTWISCTSGAGRVTWDDLARDGLPACDASVNLAGMHILNPRRTLEAGYAFRYPHIDGALADLVRTTV